MRKQSYGLALISSSSLIPTAAAAAAAVWNAVGSYLVVTYDWLVFVFFSLSVAKWRSDAGVANGVQTEGEGAEGARRLQ